MTCPYVCTILCRHSVVWDASDLSEDIYFGTVTAGKYSQSMKMMLLKLTGKPNRGQNIKKNLNDKKTIQQ